MLQYMADRNARDCMSIKRSCLTRSNGVTATNAAATAAIPGQMKWFIGHQVRVLPFGASLKTLSVSFEI
jgi:hypothetical protein